MPNLHQFTKALGMKPDYVDPRTGELKFKAPGSWEALPSSAFSDYPIRGFDRKEVPATELYEENGATPPAPEEPTDRARRVGEGARVGLTCWNPNFSFKGPIGSLLTGGVY